ncbi:MAG: GntR family transcriptional regulator, partial [Magnetovibrio sp.]|nr:GntR family transcriptional regulator [Magnetovibrio sp.]
MERGNGMALWRQIQELLKSEILSQKISPGSMLPTEKDLAARFDVNRHTVRRAITELADLGLVITRQGSGSYVPETLIDYTVQKRTRFSETISAQSRVPSVTVIHSKI